jgi:hypothetical protein
VSASHLRLLARTGRIQARKIGRDWLTTKAAVVAYLSDAALRNKDRSSAKGEDDKPQWLALTLPLCLAFVDRSTEAGSVR